METDSETESDQDISSQFDGSKKRKRQFKTPFQIEMLEKTYASEMYPSMDTMAKLSETLGLTERQVQVWFTKRRFFDKQKGTLKRASSDGEIGDQMKSLNTSKKQGVMKFKAGQLAETKTFQTGFRSAWFRCKIRDIDLEKNQILPEYYDFEPEKIKWTKIYEKPPFVTKAYKNKKQLMVRPQYSVIYHKNEMPPVSSISEVCVIIDGEWKVGNLVDWHEDDCYWSAIITKILTHDKVEIELPERPQGQGMTYEAFCKDLRPSLDWFPRKGWTLPTMKSGTSCSARLIFPSLPDGNETFIWQKTVDAQCYSSGKQGVIPPCKDEHEIHSYYQPLESCISGTESKRWIPIQNRSSSFQITPNELQIHGAQQDELYDDFETSRIALRNYWSLLTPLIVSDHPKRPGDEDPLPPYNMIRNVMGMNAVFGGLSAVFLEAGKSVWVMNVVPTRKHNTLPLILHQGFAGILHDCTRNC